MAALDPHGLSTLASDYAKGMTPIRGRRVQRLVQRAFAGADDVFIVQVGPATSAVLGVSALGAGFCATDGTGRHATVVEWLHAATHAVETRFDLWKDSLPVIGTRSVPLAEVQKYLFLRATTGVVSKDVLASIERVLVATSDSKRTP